MKNRKLRSLVESCPAAWHFALKVRTRLRFKRNQTRLRGQSNYLYRSGSILNGLKIVVRGNNNCIRINKSAIIKNSTIEILGNNNTLEIGNSCIIDQSEFCIEDNGCAIRLGSKTTVGGAHFAATEDGSSIVIGEDCMFARGIEIRTGDSHGIFEIGGRRLNEAQSITIGNHVWIGMHASILKGAQIGDGTVVATRALVSKGTYPPESILAGVSAKAVKTGIFWTRERNLPTAKASYE